MYKATVIYGTPTNPAAFDEHYQNVHLPLAGAIPDVQRVEVARGVPGPDGAVGGYVVAELYWADAEAMGKALASEAGAAAIQDAQSIATGGLQLILSEVVLSS